MAKARYLFRCVYVCMCVQVLNDECIINGII